MKMVNWVNVYVGECANVSLCVYWKAGSEFFTALVIASSFVGLASTELKKINKHATKDSWKVPRMEKRRDDRTKRGQRKKTGGEGDHDYCLLPKPSGLCVELSIQQTSAVGQAATPVDASGPFMHTHTAPESSTAREYCSSQRVQCLADLKTATTASCTGVRLSTWVAERELQQSDCF